MRERVIAKRAPRPKGPYSQGIICAGEQLYVAGQGPVDAQTGQFVGDTFEEQAILTFENLKAIVEAAGCTLANVVKVNVYLSTLDNFDQLNEIYRRYFSEPYPARTTVQSELPFMIEVDCIAVVSGTN